MLRIYVFFQLRMRWNFDIFRSEVAEGVNEASEAFIFGLNTVIALLLQTILTFAVTSEFGFNLDIRQEFLVYGSLSSILGLMFLGIAVQSRRQFFELGKRNEQQKERDIAHELASKEASIMARKSSVASIWCRALLHHEKYNSFQIPNGNLTLGQFLKVSYQLKCFPLSWIKKLC